MKKVRLLWILYVFLAPIVLSAQQITGTIIDFTNKEVVGFATVYIDGTTIGTMSGEDGCFVLKSSRKSGKIVVSHVSYTTEVIEFRRDSTSDMQVFLKPRIFRFEQVSKSGKSLREQNLEFFKNEFLGEDYWGKNAKIENDSVLFFRVEYFEDSLRKGKQKKKIKSIEVEARAPLIISLPKLGYVLQYDLIRFSEKYDSVLNSNVMNTLGYRLFIPVKAEKKAVQAKYERNRLSAYYFSPQHFTYAFAQNKLYENGYILYEYEKSPDGSSISFNYFHPDTCECVIFSQEHAMLTGMKDHYIRVLYFGSYSKDEPINLMVISEVGAPKKAGMFLKDDICIFRKDGSLPGGSVIFSFGLAEKRMGAALPYDYHPFPKQKKEDPGKQKIMKQSYIDRIRL